MADNLNEKGPADRSRINLGEEWEVRYWMQRFKVTREQLRAAVNEVGNSAERVEAHLGR